MADNSVFITGVAGGAFEDALGDLPPWATENTAIKIESILRKNLNIQTQALRDLVRNAKGRGTGAGGSTSGTSSELDKLIKSLKKLNEEAGKSSKRNKEKEKEDNKSLFNLKNLRTEEGRAAAAFQGLVIISGKIKEAMVQNFMTYAQLQQGGINVVAGLDTATSGFEALQQITALTGIRFTELSATMAKYSIAVNAFTAGKFAKTVGIASKDLAEFGYSSKESADLLGVYLDSQKGFTDNRNKSEQEVALDLVQFGKRITDVSMATGQAREKILENLNAISKSTEATLLSAQIGDKQSQVLQEFVASFADQKLGRDILKMMTDAIKPLNATFSAMQKTGGGAFATAEMNLVNKLKNSGASAEEMQKAMADFVGANEASIKRQIQQNNLLAQVGNQEAAAASEHLTQLLQNNKNYHSTTDVEKKKLADTNKARSDFTSAWERLMSQFQRSVYMITPVLDGLTWGFEKINGFIESITGALGPTVTSLIGIGVIVATAMKSFGVLAASTLAPIKWLREGLISILNPFKSFGGFVLNILSPFAKLYAAFEAGQAIGTFIYNFISKFSTINGLFDMIFSGIDKLLAYIPGSIGADARERIGIKEKSEATIGPNQAPAQTEISVPKNPSPSTINSPSSMETTANNTESKQGAPVAVTPSTPVGPGIEKPPSNSDINSMMAFQNSVLEQILLGIQNSVSVNKDILKYARNSV